MSTKGKMMTCKHCGQEIAAAAKTCPHCGGKNKKPVFKKWWFWTLIVLVVFMAVGTGDEGAKESAQNGTTEVAQSSAKIADAAGQDKTGSQSAGKENESGLQVENAATEKTTIEEQVIFDAQGVKITAKEYVEDSFWGEGVKLLIENTSEKDYGVSCDALIVNDFMVSELMSTVVAAGKSANETLYIYSSELNAAGIDKIGKIEAQFHLYDADSYATVCTGDFAVIETSQIGSIDTTADIDGVELMNLDGIRILAKAVDEDSFWGAAVVIYTENNSGKDIIVSCEDCSVNGFMMTPWLYSTVYTGKKAVDSIEFLSSQLEENGIEKIEEIELKIKVLNAKDFSQIHETDPITIINQ